MIIQRCLLLLLTCLLGLLSSFSLAETGDIHYLQVRKAIVRKQAFHWAAKVTQATYGDRLTEIGQAKSWVLIKLDNAQEGYVHRSALSRVPIVVKGKTTKNMKGFVPGQSSIVLAGKGWNKEIEAQYSSEDPALAYDLVDQMEHFNVNQSELKQFMKSGGLIK